MPEVQTNKIDGINQQKTPVERKSLQQTIDEATSDGMITKAELEDIIDRLEEEKGKITDKSREEVQKCIKDVGTEILRNGLTVDKSNLDGTNRILTMIYGVGKVTTAVSFPKGEEAGAKDSTFVIIDESGKGELTIYTSGELGERLGVINNNGQFESDTSIFDRNRILNDDKADINKKIGIKVEKKPAEEPKAEEVKPEPKAEKTKPAESVKIDKTSLETKGITPYTKKNYSKYFEDINKLDFSKVKNADEKEKIKNALQNPSKENVETLQKIVGAKKIDKPQIDGKFGDNTMKALQTYVASESAKLGEGEKAATTTVSRSMDANSQNIADAKKSEGKPEGKPEEKKPEPKDNKQPKLRKGTKAEGPENTTTPGATPAMEGKPTAVADVKNKAPVQEAKVEGTREAPKA